MNEVNNANPEFVPIDVACGPNNVFVIGRRTDRVNIT